LILFVLSKNGFEKSRRVEKKFWRVNGVIIIALFEAESKRSSLFLNHKAGKMATSILLVWPQDLEKHILGRYLSGVRFLGVPRSVSECGVEPSAYYTDPRETYVMLWKPTLCSELVFLSIGEPNC
jgi:hypothetical protein